MFTLYTRRYQPRSTDLTGRWPTIGEHITAEHIRSMADGVPDPDWLPWPPTARDFALPLPRHERTPYRVWEVMELRARGVRWSRIAMHLRLPEHALRSWIHRLATR